MNFSCEIEGKYISPKISGNFRYTNYEEDGTHLYMEGVRGRNATARVMIETKYGSVKID